jgi:hypothetical protein
MKLVSILAACVALLSSCTKNKEYCWTCTAVFVTQATSNGTAEPSMTSTQDKQVCGMTEREKEDYEAESTHINTDSTSTGFVTRDYSTTCER